MKQHIVMSLCALGMLSAPSSSSPSGSQYQAAAIIKSDYNHQVSDLNHGNVKGFLSYCSQDYRDTGNLDEYLNLSSTAYYIKTILKLTHNSHFKYQIVRLEMHGDHALAVCNVTMSALLRKSGGEIVQWKTRGIVLETWTLTNAGWRKQITRSISAQSTVNGNPV